MLNFLIEVNCLLSLAWLAQAEESSPLKSSPCVRSLPTTIFLRNKENKQHKGIDKLKIKNKKIGFFRL